MISAKTNGRQESRLSQASTPQGTFPRYRRDAPKGVPAEWSWVNQNMIDVIREAIRSKRYPIYLHGEPGVGKTSLAGCIYRSFPGEVKWFKVVEFIRMVQQCRRDGSVVLPSAMCETTEGNLWQSRVERPACLFWDDIGLRNPTGSQYEIAYELVNRRCEMPTVYTSNLSLDQIAECYDDRIASRLSAGTTIHVKGVDARGRNSQTFEMEAIK